MLRKIKETLKRRFHKLSPDLLQTHYHRAKALGVKVGKDCRLFSSNFGSEGYLIEIGNHVTIADGVQFITHDGGIWLFREEDPEADVFGKIIIEDNVFIGINAIILPGVCLGPNTVVGAGAVVTKSFSGNGVIAGNPAKVICSLEEYKEKLWGLKLSTKSLLNRDKLEIIQQHSDKLIKK
jgi:acetyltransferase-like isoleucine patch superfamily enzyme